MKKTRTSLYFQKKYCLLVHSVTVTQKLLLATISNNCAESEVTDKTCTYAINQLLYINCIESVIDGTPVSDSQPVVKISVWGDKNTKKYDVGTVRFDMNYQKIVKPQSTVMFSKQMEGIRGIIHYKFINLKTKTITLEEYQLARSRKSQIEIDIAKDERSEKIKQLMTLLQQKNQLINQLQKQTEKLIYDNKRKNNELEMTKSFSKEKHINLNIKVNAGENMLKRQNEELKLSLAQQNQYISDLKEQIQNLTQEKDVKELELRKKLKELQKIENQRKSNFIRRDSFIQTKPRLLNSSVEPVDQQGFELPANLPAKSSIRQHKNRRHTDFGDFSVNKSFVIAKESSQMLRQQKKNQQMLKSQSLPKENQINRLTFSNMNMNSPADTKMSQIKQSKIQGKQLHFEDGPQSLSNEASDVQIRINMQKEDFKWNSIVFDQKEELQILKKKLDIYMTQNKNTEKELERCKQTIKKKDTEIRQLRRLSRKNLHLGDGSRDIIKDKNNYELELQKIEAEHDTQKITLQQEIQRIDKQLHQKMKQNKSLKISYQQASARQKTFQDRYNQLKIFNKKLSEDIIEYKQKASQYDITIIKSRELEATNKLLTIKAEKAASDAQRFQGMYQKTVGRVKDFQKEFEKLKRMQRQYDYFKHQNFSQKQAIDVYQINFAQLKKFCQRIELAYNKFLSAKKQSSSFMEGSGIVTEKQMHAKFAQLAKKFNQFQLDHYKHQMQDFKEESQFINEYYDIKKIEEKGKFMQFKQMSQKTKQEYLKVKQSQLQKVKEQKLVDLKKKMQNVERSFSEVQERISDSPQTLIVSIPQKMKRMEQKLSALIEKDQIRQGQRKVLKETIAHIKQDIKLAKSSAFVDQNLKVSAAMSGTMSGKANMLQSMIQENRIKMTQLQEVKMRNESIHIRNAEQNRRLNTALMKQNSDLKLELQKLRMQSEKAERKNLEREKKWQEIHKKTEFKNKVEVDKLNEIQQKLQTMLQNTKIQLQDHKNSINALSQQLTLRNEQVCQKDYKIGLLYEKIDNLEQIVSQCERAERKMRQEVDQIKKKAELTEKEFITLMEARSQQFIKIQKIKNAEIFQLKQSIKELESTLETQMSQNFSLLKQNQTLKQQAQQIQKQAFSKVEQSKLQLQNRAKELDELYVKQYTGSKQNETLKQHLFQISSQIQNLQMCNQQLDLKVQSLQKQILIHENNDKEFKKLQANLRQEINSINVSLDDKIYKLKLYEQKFVKVQTDVELTEKQHQRLLNINQKYQITIQQLTDKINYKAEEMIKQKQENSILNIQIKKLEFLMQKLQSENLEIKKRNQQLQSQIQKYNEVAANVSNTSMLKMVRKPSNIDAKQQPGSPSRHTKGLPRRTQTLEVNDMSSINFGGITPIIPVSPQLFPKRNDSMQFRPQYSMLMRRRTSRQIPQQSKPRQDQTLIVINLEEDQSPINSNKMIPSFPPIQSQESVRGTTIGNLIRANVDQQEIREATEQNQEQNTLIHNNYNFEDKDQPSQITERQAMLKEYQEKIQELEQELQRCIEQNETLKNQNLQLHQKLQETAHIGSRQNQKVSQNLAVEQVQDIPMIKIDSARRPLTIEQRRSASFKTSREILIQDSLNNSRDLRKKSQNGAFIPQNQYAQLKEKYQSAEVQIQDMHNQIKELKDGLQQLEQDNEKLMQETVSQSELMEKMSQELEEARWQVDQSKKFEVFEEMYKNQAIKVANCQAQIEQLTGEILQKDQVIAHLNAQNSENIHRYNAQRDEAARIESQKQQVQSKVKQLSSYIQRMKIQYRKYQQDSQLQIVHLREEVDLLKVEVSAKKQEVQEMAEKYLQLETEKDDIANQLSQTKQFVNNKQSQIDHSRELQSKIQQQLNKGEQSKQNLYRTIKKLEKEVLQRTEEIRNMADQSTLSIKKYEIKLESDKVQMINLTQRIAEKQKVISMLKNQIALYNQQCQQLKKSNDSLNFQLVKVQRQLKDIMQVYEKEIEGLRLQTQTKSNQLAQINKRLKQKEIDFSSLSKQLRATQKERDYAQSQSIQHQSLLERVKQNKNKEYGEINTKLQFSINQCEKLKVSLQKTKDQLQSKQNEIKQLTKSNDYKFRIYKEKYERYEKIIEDFSDQLKKVEQRPTSQAYEEVIFQNQLLRNHIQQLKEEVSKASSKIKQQQIYLQFRKYKANKQREIQDLQAQMQKYGLKINELQQSLFILKRENEGLLKSNSNLQQEKEQLEMEYQNVKEEIIEVQKQLQFYKKRKILDMQKLLNDTQ